MNESVSDGGDRKTAPATPGPLKNIYMKTRQGRPR